MARITTSLFRILVTELKKEGFSDYYQDNRLIFLDDTYSFMKKVMNYDSDVEKIVNAKFFRQLKLNDETNDKLFKRAFVNRFLDRDIQRQTVEAFSTQVTSVFLLHSDYLNFAYENITDLMSAKQLTDTLKNNINLSDYRNLLSTLPDDNINLNVDDTILDYGDSNTISRTKNKNDDTGNTTSKKFDIDTFNKTFDILERAFIEFDKKCFLQTW